MRAFVLSVLLSTAIASCGGDTEAEGSGLGPAADLPAQQDANVSGAGGAPQTPGTSGGAPSTPAATGGAGSTPAATGGDPGPLPNGGQEAGGGSGGELGSGQPPAGGESGAPMPSSGCGASDWPAAGEHTIDVDGTTREYIVGLPEGYDAATPLRLIFAWHGLGGTASQIASGFRGGYYGLESRAAGSAIFVAGQGLESMSGGAGWPNTGGRDVAFVRALLDWLRSSYCIDDNRIFSTGMSYGGIMSNTIGCQVGDALRAIAPMAGSGPRTGFGGQSCTGQVAAWITHGNEDTVVSYESGLASRDHWAQSNGCGDQTTSVGPDGCVAYEGCDAGYPVHFCEFDGGHTVPSFAADAIWAFFEQF